MNLKNKRVLVTGGAVRIGESICRIFASHGSKIIIHYNNSEKEALKLFDSMGGKDKGHILTKGNLTSDKYINSLISSLGQIDILINNASIFECKTLINEDITSAKHQFETNFWAPFNLMQQFRKQNLDNGLIINILDRRINTFDSNHGSYLLSKKSLADATKLAALQWAPSTRVNGIAPGFVLPPPWMPNSTMQKSISLTPLKKSVNLDEIAKACVFLAESDSITGEIIMIDGGLHLL